MSKEKKNRMVPNRRFPEFNEAEEWQTEPLGNVYNFISTNSFTRDDLNYENGNVKNIHYGDIHTRFATLFDITKELVPFINTSISLEKINDDAYCVEGDMVFADASEDLKDVGKSIEIFYLNNEKVLSGMHTLQARQKEKKLAIGFAGHLFMSEDVRKQIQREAQGAKVLGISATRLSNIFIAYPKDKAEQQKIASCLSSLDDLITAHTQKLEALKTHKKGLMQQLFPAEGSTIPKLRFAKFKDCGEWEKKPLGSVCSNIASGKDKNEEDGEYPLYGSTGIIGKTNSSSFNGKFILVARVGANAGLLTLVNDKFGVTDNTLVIFLNDSENLDFFYYTLERIGLNKLVFGSGQPLITGGQLKNLIIYFPKPEEQQKIASSLSSLDELITAQAEKIEQLKNHKKGLMQGLFPVIKEIN